MCCIFRSKNTVNILIKNMLDALIGGVSYWAIGWGLSYGKGTSNFLGASEFFSYQIDPNNYPLWFFQFVFAATAATILSGAIAERVQFFAYFVYSIVITGKKRNRMDSGFCVNLSNFLPKAFLEKYYFITAIFSLGIPSCFSLGMAWRQRRMLHRYIRHVNPCVGRL